MRKLIIGIAIGAVLAAGTTAAVASIPSSDGTITACIQPQNGNIAKIIDTDAGQSCANNEQRVTWNQTGPQGPAGPQGAPGPQGPAGGLSGYEVIHQQHQLPIVSGQVNDQIFCPVGKNILSGGWQSADRRVNDVEDRPVDDGTTFRGWSVQLAVDTTQSSGDVNLQMWAVCAITATVAPTTSPPPTAPPTTPTTRPPTTAPPTTFPPTTFPPPTAPPPTL